MKTCPKCGLNKPLSSFYPQKDRTGGSTYCRACKNSYDQDRWVEKKKKAIEYKGSTCNHCSLSFPYPAMQFHHVDPSTKDVAWNKLRLRSWDKVTLELDKCVLLCANCHSIHHSALSS